MIAEEFEIEDGYYWARHDDGTTFVVLMEFGLWYTVGIEHPINFDPCRIIASIADPLAKAGSA